MYILKNAVKNIFRNRGRNILMAAIIFAIIATTVVALIINNTANAVIVDYKERFASEAVISPDMAKVRSQNNGSYSSIGASPQVSPELLLAFTESEYLKESVISALVAATNTEIIAIDENNGNGSLDGSVGDNFKIYGDFWSNFNDGMRTLDDGRMPAADNECLVSYDLAQENSLSVGDTLSFTCIVFMKAPEDLDIDGYDVGDTLEINGVGYTVQQGSFISRVITYELDIVGIYLDATDEYPAGTKNIAYLNRRNEVLTTLNTLLAQRAKDETNIEINAKYYLRNPDLLSAFEEEIREKGLSDLFIVSTDAAAYERVVKPVEGLKSISLTFMLVVVLLGAIILLLLCSISIRERKYEIGVLRAMGMKKHKVAADLISEILMITCACLIIGIGGGIAVAQPVTDSLLQSQVEALEQNGGGAIPPGAVVAGQDGISSNSDAKPLSEMNVSVGWETIAEIICVALALATVAGLASITKITKYEPIKILMERN
jgi:putative ABC transport system permease protein